MERWRTGRDYPNDSIAKNGQNPETSPGDLRRLAVIQTPVKNHQLTLMWKTLKEYIIMWTISQSRNIQNYWGRKKKEISVDISSSRHQRNGIESKNKKKNHLLRTRKLFETKRDRLNLIPGINAKTDFFVRCSGSFLNRTRVELRGIVIWTRKLINMHEALHLRDDIRRLHVARKEGGLANVEDRLDGD